MKRTFIIVIVLGAVALIIGAGIRQVRKSKAELAKSITQLHDENGVPVEVSTVKTATFELSKTYLGTVEGSFQAGVTTTIADEVVEVPVQVGESVKEGQIVCVLDAKASMAQYNQLKMAYEDARLDAERMEALYNAGAISKQMLEKAQLNRDITEENLETSSKVVSLVAPFSGTITEVNVRPGQYTEPGKPVVKVSNFNRVKIKFSINHDDWRLIKKNTNVGLRMNGSSGNEIPARITDISLSANPENHLFSVWVEAENKQDILQPGLLVDVNVAVIQKPESILIPRAAVVTKGTETGVFVVGNDKKVSLLKFKKGLSNSEVVEVPEGLQPGQTIVIFGQNNLEDGLLVNIVASR